MDDIVIRAMARWPDVPDIYGYLALDLRGRWLLENEPVTHPRFREFIERNYQGDEHGRWFFQNGPQRVFVALAYTPWIYRLCNGRPETHTGQDAGRITGAWLDEQGRLLLDTRLGIGVLDDRDLPAIADCLVEPGAAPSREIPNNTAGDPQFVLTINPHLVPVHHIRSADVPGRFGFQPEPGPTDNN